MGHRVIVVGAGIVGASIAYYLARGGVQVTILEQYRPANGATGKSFGWINANFSASADYFSLREASMVEYHSLAADIDTNFSLQWKGSLWWEFKGEDFNQYIRHLEIYGYPVNIVTAGEFKELESYIAHAPGRSANFPSEGTVDPVALTNTLIAAAKHNGATLLCGCKVNSLLQSTGCCVGVETDFGEFHADTVVIAVGALAESFLSSPGINLPMNNQVGLIARTLPVASVLDHVLLSPKIHFHQHADGSILLGENYSGGKLNDDPLKLADDLLTRLHRYLPDVSGLEIGEITLGVRPIPMDGLPVLGTSDNLGGLYIASMHSGVTLAPIVGKLAANEILQDKPEELLNPFRLNRFTQNG